MLYPSPYPLYPNLSQETDHIRSRVTEVEQSSLQDHEVIFDVLHGRSNMPAIQELERVYPTPIQSAEIPTLQTPKRVDMVPGLGRESKLNEETGFVLWLEVRRFYDDLNFALYSGKDLVGALNFATNELEVNIRTYNAEFIKSKTALLHKERFDVVDGVQRMVGNNGRPVVDAISAQERNGSVLEAARIVEPFLLSAEPNSYAVTMSPSGWSGYDLRHKNAQVMVSWKNQEGSLRGLTFVTDLSEEQTRQVMISLGVSEEVLKGENRRGLFSGENEQERVANIVRNPALLSFPGSGINPFEYVLGKILAVRGSGDIHLLQKDGSVEIRSVEQTKADIRRFNELLIFDQEEEECISELREFIMRRAYQIGDRSTQVRIVKEIENTVLKLAREHLRKNDTAWKGMPYDYRGSMQQDYGARITQGHFIQNGDDFRLVIAFLESRGGCPAGGSSAIRALGGVSLGLGSSVGSGSFVEGGNGMCAECGKLNTDNHYHCPDCKHRYADETSRPAENRTKQCGCGFKFGC